MTVSLEVEYKFYLIHRQEFVRRHPHKFVLIKDKHVVDFFGTYEDALTAGLKHFGNVAFFIKEIRKKEEGYILHQRI